MVIKGIITLTTDFGLKDSYVGEMKGAILSVNAGANIMDITHMVSPQNIIEGALVLSRAYLFYPPGTIHVAVIDPGVGSSRRPILIETEKYFFVGPDNGLFTPVFEKEKVTRVIHLVNSEYFLDEVSNTFHGRDIFGPVAAHLSMGVRPESFGTPVESPVLLELPSPVRDDMEIRGEVLYIDSFGNLITNIIGKDVVRLAEKANVMVTVKGARIRGLSATYSDGVKGDLLALVGSSGYLEIACSSRRASEMLNVREGDSVTVEVLEK